MGGKKTSTVPIPAERNNAEWGQGVRDERDYVLSRIKGPVGFLEQMAAETKDPGFAEVIRSHVDTLKSI